MKRELQALSEKLQN